MILMKHSSIAIVLMLHVLCSCERPIVYNVADVQVYINEESNGLIHSLGISDEVLTVCYHPVSIVTSSQLQGVTDENEKRTIIDDCSRKIYFTLRVSKGNQELSPSDLEQVKEMYQKNPIRLETADSVISPLAFFHFPTFGHNTSSMFMITFPLIEKQLNDDISIHLMDLSGHEAQSVFKLSDIEKIPILKY